MFTRDDLKKIEEETIIFFQKMSFAVEVKASFEDETLVINIKTDEPRVLIGERGTILACVERLLKAILQKKLGQEFYLNADINEYKKKKAQYLRELAEEVADRVALTKEEESLPAMSSFERRIVHLHLALRPDIKTESLGEEPERRVVVKPNL